MATHVNKRKGVSHQASFKVKVTEYAIEHKNNVQAASFYGVNERQVRDCRKALDDLKKMDKTKKARRGAAAQCPESEAVFVEWVEDQRQNGYAVSRLGIQLKALRMCKEGLHPYIHPPLHFLRLLVGAPDLWRGTVWPSGKRLKYPSISQRIWTIRFFLFRGMSSRKEKKWITLCVW